MHSTDIHGRRRLGLALVAGSLAFAAAGLATAMPAGAAAPTASVADDTLTVTGSSAADRIALRLAPGLPDRLEVDFGDDGLADATFDRATFRAVRVALRSGGDQFRVDQVNGTFADEQLTVEGDSGNDSLDGGDGVEVFLGGSGNDAVDGNRGNDTGVLGSGRDTFRWDPGDGSDVVEGQSGHDTLDFNGAGVAETMSLAPNGPRTLFLRDVASIRMDMDGVEALDLTALGGADTITVEDMSGTDFRLAEVDLSAPAGGPDLVADSVTVNGSGNDDEIAVDAGAGVEVTGLRTTTSVAGSEQADQLVVNGQAGDDTIDVDPAVNALVSVVANP
jgi:Ca2+-binding RTX toxin-like protein